MLRLAFPQTGLEVHKIDISTQTRNSFVCLQTMWRSCGTYLWSKFRNDPSFCTFIEPCHEKLLSASSEMFQKDMEGGITETLRHPVIDKHYFAEFPFQENGGVKFFQKRFSFENFYLPEDALDFGLDQYISYLLTCARDKDQRSFAKFCRFGMKTAWLKKNFQPTMIYVVRDPDAMFRSYWSLGGKDSYFLSGLVLTISKNRTSPLFQEIANEFSIPLIECATVAEEINAAHKIIQGLNEQALRDICMLLWALTLKHNMAHADVILDVDSLALNPTYRKEMEDRLTQDVGISFTFHDIKQPRQAEAPGTLVSPQGIEIVRRSVRNLQDTFHPSALQVLSAESRELFEATL
jgi:hypothetical protein